MTQLYIVYRDFSVGTHYWFTGTYYRKRKYDKTNISGTLG